MVNNLEGINMPELVIYNFLKTVQEIVSTDLNSQTDKTKSLLYKLFGKDMHDFDKKFESYDYFKQAERIIAKDGFSVNLGYNSEVSSLGAMHILMPSESGEPMSIGGDEGYQGYDDEENEEGEIESTSEIFTQKFNTNFNILFSSENSMEVMVMYHFIKACFVSLYSHLELYGFQNVKIGGGDIQMQSDLVPAQIFHRTLTLSFGYEMIIPNLYKQGLANYFKLTGIILPLK